MTLERIDNLHSTLSRMVLEGADLDRIAAEVGRAFDVGVWSPLRTAGSGGAALDRRAAGGLAEAALVDHTGRVRVERLRDRRRRGRCPAGDRGGAAGEGGGGGRRRRAAGLRQHRRGSSDGDDVLALERAATVVALVVTQQRAVAAVENKYRGDFLRDVFLGEAGH